MVQFFSDDNLEMSFYGFTSQVFDDLLATLAAWYKQRYEDYGLGEIIFDLTKVPLTNAIPRDVFIKNYGTIFEHWQHVGSRESYLTVFGLIFGPDSIITLTDVARGHFKIGIQTKRNQLFDWITSRTDDGKKIVTDDGRVIKLRHILGINDFYEIQAVLNSLNPAGIFLSVTLNIKE